MSYGKNPWYKPKGIRAKLVVTIMVLLLVRLFANIPVPFINHDYLKQMLAGSNSAYSLINLFSGGSFDNMTLMALGVTPYITASIILQLLGVIFPRLAQIPKEGLSGQKKWRIINAIVGAVLGVVQGLGIALTLKHQSVLSNTSVGVIILLTLCWTVGAVIAILAGEYISEFGVGNGISLILAFNIMVGFSNDIMNFYFMYIKLGASVWTKIIAVASFVAIALLLVMGTILLNNAEKQIPLSYSAKGQYGNTSNRSYLPIKLNLAGVMPVIFASTVFSTPLMFISGNQNKYAIGFTKLLSSRYWFDKTEWWWTLGLVLYFVLVICFAYFYVAISFDPTEKANTLKKQKACIPGIRPGKPTADYLNAQIKYMTFYGALFLFILTQIPSLITHFTALYTLSFGGTSIIIVVGVLLETAQIIKTENYYTSFNDGGSKSFLGLSSKSTGRGFLG